MTIKSSTVMTLQGSTPSVFWKITKLTRRSAWMLPRTAVLPARWVSLFLSFQVDSGTLSTVEPYPAQLDGRPYTQSFRGSKHELLDRPESTHNISPRLALSDSYLSLLGTSVAGAVHLSLLEWRAAASSEGRRRSQLSSQEFHLVRNAYQ